MGHIAEIITGPFTLSRMYAEGLVKDIPADKFRRKPDGIDVNSPAFNFGHLAVYPERILTMIGREDLALKDTRYADLFSAGKPGLDDPDGTVYPAMGEIMSRFYERYAVAVETARTVDESVFQKPNPSANENFRKMLPTVGLVVAFLLDGHCQTHLGQVSAWRRCMGMAAAFPG
ncbi:MAG: DinB family protein [Phycisphaerales bacterium]